MGLLSLLAKRGKGEASMLQGMGLRTVTYPGAPGKWRKLPPLAAIADGPSTGYTGM